MTTKKGIDPATIMMVTFSKAATEDMKERYKKAMLKTVQFILEQFMRFVDILI